MTTQKFAPANRSQLETTSLYSPYSKEPHAIGSWPIAIGLMIATLLFLCVSISFAASLVDVGASAILPVGLCLIVTSMRGHHGKIIHRVRRRFVQSTIILDQSGRGRRGSSQRGLSFLVLVQRVQVRSGRRSSSTTCSSLIDIFSQTIITLGTSQLIQRASLNEPNSIRRQTQGFGRLGHGKARTSPAGCLFRFLHSSALHLSTFVIITGIRLGTLLQRLFNKSKPPQNDIPLLLGQFRVDYMANISFQILRLGVFHGRGRITGQGVAQRSQIRFARLAGLQGNFKRHHVARGFRVFLHFFQWHIQPLRQLFQRGRFSLPRLNFHAGPANFMQHSVNMGR
mmetsp:Transcript_12220/g.29685  ORF Transcript_12220/g.29685 Transcript_12220/m.29685 type:complete len:340 (+) Transcript_12220:301-1320(+)